jgi:GT2 family glycosyltransferase
MACPSVSIILPTFEREGLLCRALADLLELDYPAREIIVVDQTPRHRPETRDYLEAIASRIRYVRQAEPSVVMAANRGIALATGEIALFLDDDIRIPGPDFIGAHARNYDDPTLGGVAGRVLDAANPAAGTFDPRSSDPVWGFFHTGWSHATRCEVTTAPGANMSFRRDLVLRLGGFDERFVVNAFRWENDFCVRVRQAGYRVIYDPEPTVHHFYGSPGGAGNRHLMGREPDSHRWYRFFFHNHLYFALKHMPPRALPRFLWRLYRAHVLNRPYAQEGPGFLLARHRAWLAGLASAWVTYQRARREPPC